jgi:hypothetical protein
MRCDEATLVEARGASTDSIDFVNISSSRAEGYDVRKRWLEIGCISRGDFTATVDCVTNTPSKIAG